LSHRPPAARRKTLRDRRGHQRDPPHADRPGDLRQDGVRVVAYDERTAERVRKALAGRRGVTEKAMMAGRGSMLNVNMGCAVSGRGGMLVRVGVDEKVFGEPHAERVKMGARTMSGFARVNPDGYATDAALKKWVGRGLDVASALPAKAAKAAKARKAAKRAGKSKR